MSFYHFSSFCPREKFKSRIVFVFFMANDDIYTFEIAPEKGQELTSEDVDAYIKSVFPNCVSFSYKRDIPMKSYFPTNNFMEADIMVQLFPDYAAIYIAGEKAESIFDKFHEDD